MFLHLVEEKFVRYKVKEISVGWMNEDQSGMTMMNVQQLKRECSQHKVFVEQDFSDVLAVSHACN